MQISKYVSHIKITYCKLKKSIKISSLIFYWKPQPEQLLIYSISKPIQRFCFTEKFLMIKLSLMKVILVIIAEENKGEGAGKVLSYSVKI